MTKHTPRRALLGGRSFDRTPVAPGGATNPTRWASRWPARTEAERVADAFAFAGMRVSGRSAQCPACCPLEPGSLTVHIAGEHATCANGCSDHVIVSLLKSWSGWQV